MSEPGTQLEIVSVDNDLRLAGCAPVTAVRGRGLQIVASLSDGVLVTGTDGRVGVVARFDRA